MFEPARGRFVPASVTLPRIRTPRGSWMSSSFRMAPLVQANSTFGTRYGWPGGANAVTRKYEPVEGVAANHPRSSARKRVLYITPFCFWLAAMAITAPGIGWPVSAARTRPSMTLAGSSDRVISFPAAASVLSINRCCRAKRLSSTVSLAPEPRPMPEMVAFPWSSVLTGRGQARRPSGGLTHQITGPSAQTSAPFAGAPVTSTSRTRIGCSGRSFTSADGRSASGFRSPQPRP